MFKVTILQQQTAYDQPAGYQRNAGNSQPGCHDQSA
jgi:hypothetical protein